MKALANEVITPPNQKAKEPKSYEIKALTSLEFTKLLMNGSDKLRAYKGMDFDDVVMTLNLGLVDPSVIPEMASEHHMLIAKEIFMKANLADEERKNS